MKKRTLLLCAVVMVLMFAFVAPLSAAEFTDVNEGDWFYDYVCSFTEEGIVNGYPDNTFRPENPVTRGEFVKLLGTIAEVDPANYLNAEIPFADVPANHWARPFICWAYDSAIVEGKSATTFDPDGHINRQEAAVMIYRFAEYAGFRLLEWNEPMAFTDTELIADWAKDEVIAVQQAGIINGYPDGSFNPTGNAKRSEAVKILYYLLEAPMGLEYADSYVFDLEKDNTEFCIGYIFEEDVTINGDYGEIYFGNCIFLGDIILTSKEGTKVFLEADSVLNGKIIFDNGVKEGSMDYNMPKVLTYAGINAETKDCIGSVIAFGPFGIIPDITYNGKTYGLEDAELFYDEEIAGFVPYEDQYANILYVGQWWESGEQVFLIECEEDPTLDMTVSDQYVFDLEEGDDAAYTDYIFYDDVTINGDNANIYFGNCIFLGDIILTSKEGTKLIIDSDCELHGNVIFDNDVKEANIDYSMPKVFAYTDISAVAEDCIGTVIAFGGASLEYNGTEYTIADCDYFEDGENNFVPYTGQEADTLYIGQWWENEEQVIFKLCFKTSAE